jgi:phosphoribosylglycinamide formyltransferase-1
MVALVDAVQRGDIPNAEVALVISDRADAAGLEKARERGVETIVIERHGRTREEHDAEIVSELKKCGVDIVCLAGYMRLLSPSFVAAFPNRILNIHPSLLPAYPGLNIHERVLAAGETVSGCTVHFVNEDVDAGAAVVQRTVEVLAADTEETLSGRVLLEEHKAYVEAVKIVLKNIERDRSG